MVTEQLMTIDEYALDMVTSGAASVVEDDLNEDGKIADSDLKAARVRAYQVIEMIRQDPETILRLTDLHVAKLDRLRKTGEA